MPNRLAPRERHLIRPLVGFCLALALSLALVSPAAAHLGLHDQISELDALLALHPLDAEPYLKRGELRRAHGELPAALRDFERAAALDPSSAEARFWIGRTHLEAGRAGDARSALDLAIALKPDHVGALAARGRALAALGLRLESAADFTRAIQAHTPPDVPDPDLYLARAAALAAAGEAHLADALRGLDEGLARLGPAVSLQLAAIDLEMRLGHHDAALQRLDLAATRSPRKERWLARRGEILARAGRPDEARAAYEAALAAIGNLPPRRRAADAVGALEGDVRAALGRLAPVAPGSHR